MRRRLPQRIHDAVEVVLRVGLEIGIPFRLLAEDDLAINHRCGLAITAAEIETDATAFEIAPERTGVGAFRRDVLGADYLDGVIKHPFADDLGIELPCGVIAIMRSEFGR